MSDRHCEYTRTTSETSITVSLNLDGGGVVNVDTGMGFADHMLTLLAFWAGFDMALSCSGDLEVDGHHSLEDIGLCLGHCLKECLGDKKGIQRVGWSRVPMDEALAEVTIDLSGRPYLVHQGDTLPATIAGQETDVWREFFKSLAFSGAFNLHIDFKYGLNGHHLLESAFKGLGLALRQAASFRDVQGGVLSTKGSLDQ